MNNVHTQVDLIKFKAHIYTFIDQYRGDLIKTKMLHIKLWLAILP